MSEPTREEIEAAAKASFEADWPKDEWSRFSFDDHVPERYRKIVRAALTAASRARPSSSTEAMRAALWPFVEIAKRFGWDQLPDDHHDLNEHILEAPADDIAPGAVFCLHVSAFRGACQALSATTPAPQEQSVTTLKAEE